MSRERTTDFAAERDSIPQVEWKRMEPSTWAGLLGRFADASFYQTHAYGSVRWGTTNLLHLVVRDENGVRAVAQVRLSRFAPRWGVAYVRWGPCVWRRGGSWDREAFHRALTALEEEFVHRHRYVLRVVPAVFSEDPEAEWARRALREIGFVERNPGAAYRTLRVDVALPIDAMRKQLEQKWRNQLNAALRNNLEVVEGEDVELFRRFLLLYDEMMARKRFETTVNPRQFARMQELLQEGEKLRIALAGRDGRWHAGVVASSLGQTGIYLLGATAAEGLKSKASYLLQWHMLEHLHARGCRWYDLGGINPQINPGVYHFKSGMGGQEVRQLGCYERAPDRVRLGLLHWAERLHRLWNRWSRVQ